MKFKVDMWLTMPDGERIGTVIGAAVPKKYEEFFLAQYPNYVEGGKSKPATDDGARKSPADKMAPMPEATKK